MTFPGASYLLKSFSELSVLADMQLACLPLPDKNSDIRWQWGLRDRVMLNSFVAFYSLYIFLI